MIVLHNIIQFILPGVMAVDFYLLLKQLDHIPNELGGGGFRQSSCGSLPNQLTTKLLDAKVIFKSCLYSQRRHM